MPWLRNGRCQSALFSCATKPPSVGSGEFHTIHLCFFEGFTGLYPVRQNRIVLLATDAKSHRESYRRAIVDI